MRLQTLRRVGLGYLTLDRSARTLSGGEPQRVALADARSAAALTGTMFVLDEPTRRACIRATCALVAAWCGGWPTATTSWSWSSTTRAVIAGADRVIELGPGAGAHGGAIVFDGTPDGAARRRHATGRWLRDASPAASAASAAARRA